MLLTGAVRASLGHSNTFEDCDLFLTFLLDNFLNKAPAVLSAPLMSDRVSQSKSLSAMTGSDVDDLCLTTQISVPRELRGTSGNPTEVASTPAATACIDIITAGTIRLAAIFVYPIKSCAGIFQFIFGQMLLYFPECVFIAIV